MQVPGLHLAEKQLLKALFGDLNPKPLFFLLTYNLQILRTMKDVTDLAYRYKHRSIIPRILSSKTDPGKMQELQREMQSSLQIFQVLIGQPS